jgi:hypothetical protein
LKLLAAALGFFTLIAKKCRASAALCSVAPS